QVVGQPDFNPNDPFSSVDSFRINTIPSRKVKLQFGDKLFNIGVRHEPDGGYRLNIDGNELLMNIGLEDAERGAADTFRFQCDVDNRILQGKGVWLGNKLNLFTQEGNFEFSLPVPKWVKATSHSGAVAGGSVAPMPGVIEKVMVQPGKK